MKIKIDYYTKGFKDILDIGHIELDENDILELGKQKILENFLMIQLLRIELLKLILIK